ncbi:MAG TPA: hypothetical protein GX719_02600 [Gammaproteobacteria bacterium]|nr:hypothetical protein [Gammaproteobacteria bacterium]
MLLFPQRVILTRFGRYAIHGYACRSTSEALLKHRYIAQGRGTPHLFQRISKTHSATGSMTD